MIFWPCTTAYWMRSWMSFSVALRLDSGTCLYSSGCIRSRKCDLVDLLTKETRDTTVIILISFLLSRVAEGRYTSKASSSKLQSPLRKLQIVCSKQKAQETNIWSECANGVFPLWLLVNNHVFLTRWRTHIYVSVDTTLLSWILSCQHLYGTARMSFIPMTFLNGPSSGTGSWYSSGCNFSWSDCWMADATGQMSVRQYVWLRRGMMVIIYLQLDPVAGHHLPSQA